MEELKTILEYPIVEIQDYVITPYNILLVIAILLGTRLVAYTAKLIIKKSFEAQNIDDLGKRYTLTKVITYFLYVIGIVLALQAIGLNVGLLVASSAALFVGLGLGLQSIFQDIVSGFILLFEGVVKKGDIVEIGSTIGRVEQLDIRTSKIRSRDGIMLVVPNSKLTSNDVINWSHSNLVTRFRITVGVAYGSDTALVRDVLVSAAKKHPDVLKDQPIHVRFEDFGDSALIFELYFWAEKTWEIEFIKSDIRFTIDAMFRKNGIQIPFPQRDLHIISDKTKG
jgi:small-conductance mechanosensitive channel